MALAQAPACEGAWGASEAIGRFAMIVVATPMVMSMREAVRL